MDRIPILVVAIFAFVSVVLAGLVFGDHAVKVKRTEACEATGGVMLLTTRGTLCVPLNLLKGN